MTAPFPPLSRIPAAPAHFVAPDARGFGHVRTWIFDLDNTLYSHESGVWPQIDDRITLYVSNLMGIDLLSARALQKYYYHRYGTTLRALMSEHGIDPYDFMDFVHDIDHAGIELNEALGTAIARLPGRRLILTNGSRRHAEAIAGKIGILDHFEDVFDLADANFTPKPDRGAYEAFLRRHTVVPQEAAMFEDIAKNLVVPHDIGMTTTLVIPKSLDPGRERFEQEAVAEPHVDYITNDLASFLATMVGV
ncbi:pyrimidine 5'-nucleotidase [Salinarimonas sp.]|uniref:pyrimidine 5'-nucleotidase n=1 Tax=Salinarimonas sp. TaxID=2766526 RepID=UPI00391A3FE4